MKSRNKVIFGILGFYALSLIAIFLIFGFTRRDNEEFKPQNEFKLDTWINLPGPFDINKAVLYLVIAAGLTIFTMVYVARRMHDRPNKVQTAVEWLFSLMRDNITRGNMDDRMAAKWFPFIGALFLFIWFSNLIGYIPLPTNTQEKFEFLGVQVPAFAIYSATAPLYAHYATLTLPWLPPPLSDQQVAGGIMWLAGDLLFLLAILLGVGAWMRAEDVATAREDKRLDAERDGSRG